MTGDKESTGDKDTLNTTSPLYMHPSESANSVLVPVDFDDTDTYLGGEVCLDLSKWTIRLDSSQGNVKNQQLDMQLWLVGRTWRYGDFRDPDSLSKDLADSLQYVNDVKELWQELEDIYDQTNGAKLHNECTYTM